MLVTICDKEPRPAVIRCEDLFAVRYKISTGARTTRCAFKFETAVIGRPVT